MVKEYNQQPDIPNMDDRCAKKYLIMRLGEGVNEVLYHNRRMDVGHAYKAFTKCYF
jgi:hypothetical protein